MGVVGDSDGNGERRGQRGKGKREIGIPRGTGDLGSGKEREIVV